MSAPQESGEPAAPAATDARVDKAADVRRGLIALVGVQVSFGLFPVFGGLAMDPVAGFAPFAVAAWRITIGAVVLFALSLGLFGRRAIPARRDLLPLALFAFLGIVLNQGLFLVGLQKSTPMNAGLVICLIPVFAYSVAVCGRREAFHPRRALGVVVALAGAIPLFVAGGADLASEHAVGNLMMAGNALCYAFYLVYSKPLLARMPALVLVAWIYILSLPWLPLFVIGHELAPATASTGAWWSLAYVIVFPTIVAYALNSYALARVEASTTAFFVFAQPLITALAAWILMNEAPTPALGLAALGLFAGMALVVQRTRPRAAIHLKPS